MNNIYLVTEECITDNQIKFICSKYNPDISYSNLIFKQLSQNMYEVSGVVSKSHDKVFIIIAKGSGSFIDILLYDEPNSIDLNKKSPKIACEVTKNLPNSKESGNMASQRLSKWATIQNNPLFASTRRIYLIDYKRKIKTKEVDEPNDRAFATMAVFGVEIYFKSLASRVAIKYRPKTKKKKLVDFNYSGKTNWIGITNTTATLETNFYKNITTKTGHHDPNIGWICGEVAAIRVFDPNISIIVESNRPPKEILGQNKLSKILHENNAKLQYKKSIVSAPKQISKKPYWDFETTGEKLGSISLELDLRNKGKKLIFSNHAGCEKSFVKTKNGDLNQSQKARGIPDLVYLDNKIIVVEAEKHENYSGGLKQVRQKSFKQWIVRELSSYVGLQVEVYLSTNKEGDNRKHVIYDGFGNYNKTTPVYKFTL